MDNQSPRQAEWAGYEKGIEGGSGSGNNCGNGCGYLKKAEGLDEAPESHPAGCPKCKTGEVHVLIIRSSSRADKLLLTINMDEYLSAADEKQGGTAPRRARLVFVAGGGGVAALVIICYFAHAAIYRHIIYDEDNYI